MSDVLRVLIVTTVSGVGLAATLVVAASLFPAAIQRTRATAEEAPGRSFLVGLVNLFFLSAVGLAFSAAADGTGAQVLQLPALVLWSAGVVLIVLGLAGVADLICQRLFAEQSKARGLLKASSLMILGGLTPLVGWFILFPYLAMLGAGGVILGWFRARQRMADEDTAADMRVSGN